MLNHIFQSYRFFLMVSGPDNVTQRAVRFTQAIRLIWPRWSNFRINTRKLLTRCRSVSIRREFFVCTGSWPHHKRTCSCPVSSCELLPRKLSPLVQSLSLLLAAEQWHVTVHCRLLLLSLSIFSPKLAPRPANVANKWNREFCLQQSFMQARRFLFNRPPVCSQTTKSQQFGWLFAWGQGSWICTLLAIVSPLLYWRNYL